MVLSNDKSKRNAAAVPASEPLVRPKHLPLITQSRILAPDIVPARMINEVLYCERLMYLEWAQGEFADNAFTVEGRAVHRRADSAGGQLPKAKKTKAGVADTSEDDAKPEDEAQRPYQARSVWLTSEQLGLTAKIDVVEGTDDGVVVPIEYKRGAAPELREGAYLPERAQLCAQVLLLREHGYHCEHGEIYFAKSKTRVTIAITEELVKATLAAVATARAVATKPEPPPPLRDSAKCQGCSLVEICLPDEVNLLRALDGLPPVPEVTFEVEDLDGPLDPDPWGLVTNTGASAPADAAPGARVRRLSPARDDRVPLYVQDHRASIGVSGERLVVRGTGAAVHVRLMNTSQVVIQGNAQLTTQAMRTLLERGIPVSFMSGGGWFLGRATGTDSKNVDLRIAQHRRAADAEFCLSLARTLVASKIRNSRTMLRRNLSDASATLLFELKQLLRKAQLAESLDSLLGLEGAAARVYFQAFAGMLKGQGALGFDFERRNRRPPRDPINALLSFSYALLTKDLVQAVAGVGLDPLVGYYHQPRFGRPALALDMMEEFRPLIADSVVINAVNTAVVAPEDFVIVAEGCSLKPHARRNFTDAYERRMDQEITHPIFGYRLSYRRVLEVQARLLGRLLTGELEHYPMFTTR